MELLDVMAEHHMPITISLQYRCLAKNLSAEVSFCFADFFLFFIMVGKMLLSCE